MANDTADRIVFGNVITMDDAAPRAEAVAIRAGRVLAAGKRDAVLALKGGETRVDDFGSATVIPGFNDTHAHSDSQGLKTIRPSLSEARSVEDVLKRISELAKTQAPGTWIATMPVGEPPFYFDGAQKLAEGRLPTREELDKAAPNHPVYIAAPGGYWGVPPCTCVLNSAALSANGITRDSQPVWPNITIHRDGSGEPNGQITEKAYVTLTEQDLLPAVPRFTYAERLEGVRRALPLYHARGTTSIYEGHGMGPEAIACFRELHEKGELTMRSGLVISPTWASAADAEPIMRDYLAYARGNGTGDDMLRIAGVFIAYGGDKVIRDVMQRDVTDVGFSGFVKSVNAPDEFEALCELAGRYDLRMNTIVSDKLHEIVPILERVAKKYPIGKRRWVLEHVSRSSQSDLERVKKLGVAVTLIPPHYVWKVAGPFMNMTDEELDYLSPARALHELGAEVSAGTDAVPNDPLFCLWVMTTRRERTTGRIMGKNGRIDNALGLRLLTTAGAYLTFEENVKGPLKPGYYADLAVLSGDPIAAKGDDILNIRCEATMVGGRWVYGEKAAGRA